jgi:hypothetical protein
MEPKQCPADNALKCERKTYYLQTCFIFLLLPIPAARLQRPVLYEFVVHYIPKDKLGSLGMNFVP